MLAETIPFDTINFQGTNLMPVLSVSIGDSEPQPLLIDTGSSSMAFCDKGLLKYAEETAQKLDYIWCAHYQPGGAMGYVWEGTAGVSGHPQRPASYAIMQEQFAMPCGSGLAGIAGIGFKNLNTVTESTGAIEPWDMEEVKRKRWAPDCPRPTNALDVNLWHFLGEGEGRSETGVTRLGIHWRGRAGPQTGEFYLNEAAVAAENRYFREEAAQKVLLDEWGWMSIDVQSIGFAGKRYDTRGFCGWTSNATGQWNGGNNCIIDTGTPIIVIPQQIWPRGRNPETGRVELL